MDLNNDLFDSLRTTIKQNKSGLGYDTSLWLNTIQEVHEEFEENPDIFLPFARDLETDKGSRAVHTLKDRIKSFRVNPWSFANEVVSKKILGETSQSHFGAFAYKQKEFLRDLCDINIPFMIASCCRGGAKTWDAALAVACLQYCVPGLKIRILGGSKEQSGYLYEYFSKFILDSDLKYIVKGDVLQTKTRFIHGGEVSALPASQKTVRGARTHILILDECCQADSAIIKAAMPQTIVAAKAKVVMMSTPDKLIHMFRDYYMDYKNLGFKRYHWNAWECPWISDAVIERFKTVYDKNSFRIEFEGEFGSATGTVFDVEDVENSIRDKLPKKMKLYSFSHGVDWGWKHPTVSCLAGLDDQGNSWIVSSDEWRQSKEDILYTNLADICYDNSAETYADASHPFQNKTMQRECGARGLGFHMIPFNKFKMQMIANARSRLEHGRVRIYKSGKHVDKLLNELLGYSYMENSDKPMKGNDDHVDAFILCMWGHRRDIKDFEISDKLDLYDASRILDKTNQSSPAENVFDGGVLFKKLWRGY